MEQMIENRLTKLETKMDTVEHKVKELYSMSDAVLRLVIIQEGQEERNRKFDITYELQIKINSQVNSTLENINQNLNMINEEMKCTSNKVSDLENKMDEKLAHSQKNSEESDQKLITRLNEINDKSKIDVLEILKKTIVSTIVPLLGGGLVFYFLQLTGVIKLF